MAILLVAHAVAIVSSPVFAQSRDTASVFEAATSAVADYEFAVRRQAPFSVRATGGGTCDEEVGRFCVTFDTGHDDLPSEPSGIAAARDSAISRLREAAQLAPGRSAFLFPLLRYLPRAGRASEAVPFARAYARAITDPADKHMVLGLALHNAGQTEEATTELEAWVASLDRQEQEKVRTLEWLLTAGERKRYLRLGDMERAAYERRAWKYADPLLMTPGNELWTDHLARFATGRVLREMPTTASTSWGSDVEQLLVRFGEPVMTTRGWRSGSIGAGQDYVEHWDPAQRAYFPPALDQALAMHVRLDTLWPVELVPTRSGHAPPTIRAMRVLEHQAVPLTDVVRIVGAAATDSLVKNPLAGAVFLLDSALNVVTRADARPCVSCVGTDSTMLVADIQLHPKARYYSAELYDSVSRLAARARYRLDRPAGPLSGILLTHPFEPGQLPAHRDSDTLRPLSRPVIGQAERFGVYAEIDNRGRGRRSATVEIEVRSLDRGSAIRRAAGWVGNVLGISSPRSPTRLGWAVDLEPDRITAVPVTLDLEGLEAGSYRIELRMEDGAGGREIVSMRDFAVVTSAEPS